MDFLYNTLIAMKVEIIGKCAYFSLIINKLVSLMLYIPIYLALSRTFCFSLVLIYSFLLVSGKPDTVYGGRVVKINCLSEFFFKKYKFIIMTCFII